MNYSQQIIDLLQWYSSDTHPCLLVGLSETQALEVPCTALNLPVKLVLLLSIPID